MAGRPPRNFDHVEPKEIQDLLREEQALLSQLGKYRDQMSDMRSKRDALVEKERPKHEKDIAKIERQIEDQRAKKDKLHLGIAGDGAKNHREIQERQKLMDHLKMHQLAAAPLQREMDRMILQKKDLEKKVRATTKEADKIKSTLTHKTHTDIERALRNLEKKEERAKEKQHTDVLKVLGQERAKLEGSKGRVDQFNAKMEQLMGDRLKLTDIDEKIQEKIGAVEESKKKLDELQAKKDKIMGEREEDSPKAAAKRDEEIAQRQQKRDEQRKKIDDTKDAIDKLFEQKRKVIQERGSKEMKDLDEKITELVENRKRDGERLDEIRASIPAEKVTIEDTDVIGSLVGKAGATLRELEKDFNCIIDMRRAEGGVQVETVVIRGGQSKDCAEAIQAILEDAAASKFKATMEFDPELTREFIGKGGENIQRMQAQAGCSVNLDRNAKGETIEGKVILVGKQEDVEKAQQLIEDFKAANCREVVSYPPDMANVLRGPQMKQWQEEFNCRKIQKVEESRSITIIGGAADVQRAKTEIAHWLKTSKESKEEIRLGAVAPSVIIGRGGENIKAVQSETKTSISIDAGKVQIVGPKEGTARARQMIERLIAENQMDEYKVAYKPAMFNFLIRPRAWEGCTLAGEQLPTAHVDPHSGDGPRAPACLLEQIRQNTGCQRVRALKEENKVLLAGKSIPARAAKNQLMKALAFEGMDRLKVPVDDTIMRHFTRRGKGPNVIDKLRDEEGVVEILTPPPKAENQEAEIIGTPEGAAAAKAKLDGLVAEMNEKIVRLDVEQLKLRLVIGPGGATINRIQDEFAVTLNIDNKASQVVILSDDGDAVQKGKEEVERVIAAGGDQRFSGN